jgi:hypothetical protein
MGTIRLSGVLALSGAILAGGCASEGGILQTGALQSPGVAAQPSVAQAKVDPACATLASQIDTLRKDGVTERVEKVAAGKSSTVKVKRESLTKMVELTKLDAEYQAKCTIGGPKPMPVQAQVQPASSAPSVAQKAAAPATTAAAAPVAKP